jgi:hypothetical protein
VWQKKFNKDDNDDDDNDDDDDGDDDVENGRGYEDEDAVDAGGGSCLDLKSQTCVFI